MMHCKCDSEETRGEDSGQMYLYFMRLHIVRCPVLFNLIMLWIYHYITIPFTISHNNITFITKVKYKCNNIYEEYL